MSIPAAIAWYRKTEWIASRIGSLPRNANETLETPPGHQRPGQARLDAARRLDVGDGVARVLLDAGPDGEDVRVEDDVLRLEPDDVDQEPEGPGRDRDLAVRGIGLALLVEGHHDDRCAVAPAQPGVLEERRLAFLERDRVDDAAALDALQAGLDDLPARRIEHDRHRADVGLRCDEVEEPGHRGDRVEHRLVHVHVDDLGAGVDLLAGDLDRFVVAVLEDELGELARARDVGSLADVDEDATRLRDAQGLEPGQARLALHDRDRSRRYAGHGLRDRPDVGGRGPAATARDVDEPVPSVLAEELRRGRRAARRSHRTRWVGPAFG